MSGNIIENSCGLVGTIYIYDGPGTSQHSLFHTNVTISELVEKSYNIQYIGPEQINNGNWTSDCALLIMPGGADLPYAKYLNGLGNKIIKEYIATGGYYLGLCAGSYYAASAIEFDLGGIYQVVGKRELSLFPDMVIGPILASYDYFSCRGCRAVQLNWNSTEYKNYDNLSLFYNGGGYFQNAAIYPNVNILANYPLIHNQSFAAVVSINYQQGKVLLSGVHFEYDYRYCDKNDNYLVEIIPQLQKHDQHRKSLAKSLLNELRIY